MSDYAPPTGPPPPKVPEGYKAIWNDQYKEWFYVNIYTKQSQWDKPTEPIYGPPSGDAPPPGYDHNQSKPAGAEKSAALGSNNPYNGANDGAGSGGNMTEDERLARQLQEQEDSRAPQGGARGAADNYYGGPPQSTYGQPYGQHQGPSGSPMPGQEQARGTGNTGGFLGKLKNKLAGGGPSSRPGGYGNAYPQQGYGGGYPQQGYGGYPQQGYGGYPPRGYGGYPQPGYGGYGQPPRRGGGGMGMAGGAALGAGAGLLGGAMIANSMGGNEQEAYQQGFEDGNDFDGGDGGDFDGGDF